MENISYDNINKAAPKKRNIRFTNGEAKRFTRTTVSTVSRAVTRN